MRKSDKIQATGFELSADVLSLRADSKGLE